MSQLTIPLIAIAINNILALDHPVIELSGAVLQIYKYPESVRSEDLIEAAKDYLYYLIKIKEEAKHGKEESIKTLKEIYLEGNPPMHLRNIPWDKLVEQFEWNDVNINEYLDVVQDTRSVWNECLVQLERYKEPDEIL